MPEIPAILDRLLSFSSPGGSFPYTKGGEAAAEPTILALLALYASGAPAERAKPLLTWVLNFQNADGSIGVNPAHQDQGLWLTAQAVLVFHRFGLKEARDRAASFLISLKSVIVPNTPNIRQDNSLTGWPWVPGTFGWVEPTAWSLIALNAAGLAGHPRAVEGRKFLLDRRIPSGGWNYGNPGINDKELLPFWDTTGLALIALSGHTDVKTVQSSLDLLDEKQEKIESLCGLAWAALGLESYGRDAGQMKKRLQDVMNSLPDEELNVAHFAAGLIALANKKVFIT